jgi:broad specificity phosphatase PhoE
MDARVASWLQDARDSYPPDQPLWVIAHAGAIRSLLRQQKICSFNDSLSWPIGYSEFIELNLDSITTNQPP